MGKSLEFVSNLICAVGRLGVIVGGSASDDQGCEIVFEAALTSHTRTTIDRSVESIVDNAAWSQPDDVYEIALCIHRTPHVRQNPTVVL